MMHFFLFPIIYASGQLIYTFSLRWPGSVCLEEDCKDNYMEEYDWQRWNIHGLWLDSYSSKRGCREQEYCSDQRYNESELQETTIQDLKVRWVGLFQTSHSFHKHEFEKHGTCVPNTTQDDFFRLVLQLSQRYDVYKSLKKDDIIPNDYEIITRSRVIDAMNYKYKDLEIHISCIYDGDKYYIVNISFCLDEQLEPYECICNNSYRGYKDSVSCPDEFYYPQKYQMVSQ